VQLDPTSPQEVRIKQHRQNHINQFAQAWHEAPSSRKPSGTSMLAVQQFGVKNFG